MQPLEADDPRVIGEYRLLRRLGAGGMGRVYLGRSPGGRTVAVKAVHPHFAADAEFRVRFRREVESARRVGGQWTAQVLDAGPDDPVPWVATGYVAGPTLQQAVAGHGPLPVDAVRALGAGLAEALSAVHGLGLVHRDVKPSNVLLTLDGPCLIDFGIARATDGTSALTSSGVSIGSPGYMSPEQVLGRGGVGPASDVFSLGAVLAYAATGEAPFPGDSSAALLYHVVHEDPRLAGLEGPLRDLIAECLAKDAAARPVPAGVGARLAGPSGAAALAASGRLPPALVEQVSRRAVELLGLEPEREAGREAARRPEGAAARVVPGPVPAPAPPGDGDGGGGVPSGLVPFTQAAQRPAAPAARPATPWPPADAGPVAAPSASGPGPAPAHPGGPPAAGPPGRTTGGFGPGPSYGGCHGGAGREGGSPASPPAAAGGGGRSRNRFSVSANATTGAVPAGPDGLRARRLSCTLVLSVAGALAAALLTATIVFDVLPGGGGPDNSAKKPPAAEETQDGESPRDGAGEEQPKVPGAFLGTWKGSLTTDKGLPAGTMELTIGKGGKGDKVASGKVTLLALACPAEWTLVSATDDRLVMDTSSAKQTAGCTGGAEEEFVLREDGTLRYSSRDPAGGSPTGTLRKNG